FELACGCTLGGVTFLDLTGEAEEAKTSLRDIGESDPDCESCEGSGKSLNDCPICEDCGKAAKYPYIILNNEATGEARVLKLDLAQLIADGKVIPTLTGYEKLFPNGRQMAEKNIAFNVSGWIEENLTQIGIDTQNAGRLIGN